MPEILCYSPCSFSLSNIFFFNSTMFNYSQPRQTGIANIAVNEYACVIFVTVRKQLPSILSSVNTLKATFFQSCVPNM